METIISFFGYVPPSRRCCFLLIVQQCMLTKREYAELQPTNWYPVSNSSWGPNMSQVVRPFWRRKANKWKVTRSVKGKSVRGISFSQIVASFCRFKKLSYLWYLLYLFMIKKVSPYCWWIHSQPRRWRRWLYLLSSSTTACYYEWIYMHSSVRIFIAW